MSALLSALARPATRWPGWVLVAIAVVSVGLGLLVPDLRMETDLAEFGSDDSQVVQDLDRIESEFDRSSAAVQVIIDAGPEGDVLDPAGLSAVREVEAVLVDELEAELRSDADGRPRIVSLGAPLAASLQQMGVTVDGAEADDVEDALDAVLREQPGLAALTSQDRELDAATARPTTVLAELDPQLTTAERIDAGERLQDRLGIDEDALQADVEGFTVAVSSPELTNDALQEETQREAPVLLALALLVVIGILWVLLRSVFDVLVGLVGLAATLLWTFGLISLAGPGMLGWLGPLSQVGVVVPVLVVGLGIDYAVHLTARYREQRVAGHAPAEAASTALHTVGAALVLATVATALGFAMTATAPLEVIADFGVFTAIGVVVALIVMSSLVPAARVLRDRRSVGRARPVRDLELGRVMRGPAWLALRLPAVALLIGALVLGGSLWAASDLHTQFDRDDFVPEDSEIGELRALQHELFDGELTETTYVLIDGDLTDPEVFDGLGEAHARLADVEHVRTDPDGRAQATSVLTLLERTGLQMVNGQTGDSAAQGLSGAYQQLRTQSEADVRRLLSDDAQAGVVEVRTNGGDGAADDLAGGIAAAFEPVTAAGGEVAVTSDAMIIAEMADDLRDFQARSIAVTLLAVLVLLVGYYGVARRRPMLGLIAMIPSVTSAVLILGTMGLLDISFDAMTATLTAIAVGIGVPYGVHVSNRFSEDLGRLDDVGDACRVTLRTTGGALAGSALTTFGAFVVLSFSGLALIGQMGLLGAAGIAFALLAAVLIQPAALVLWARAHRRDPPAQQAAPWTASDRATSTTAELVSRDGAGNDGSTPHVTAGTRTHTTMHATNGSSPWTLQIDDPRYPVCQIQLEQHEGAAVVRSISLRPRPGEELTPQSTRMVPLEQLLELTVAYSKLP